MDQFCGTSIEQNAECVPACIIEGVVSSFDSRIQLFTLSKSAGIISYHS